MKIRTWVITGLLLNLININSVKAQNDSLNTNVPPIFTRMAATVEAYKPDTTTPPADKITRVIQTLRKLRGGFNITEAMEYKLEEERQKSGMSKADYDKVFAYFTTGNGRRWLDNATVWIYRNTFTYKELKQMVRFYKTTAGQKFANEFPVIMVQTIAAAESIKKAYSTN